MVQRDTTFLTADSSIVQIKRGSETILIVNEKDTQQSSAETNWVISLWVPLIIVVAGAGISFLLNRKKTKSEIGKLDIDASRITEEIKSIKKEREKLIFEKSKLLTEVEKMKVETENLNKSFQPYVLNTLQGIQEEVFSNKLNALKSLVNLKNYYFDFDKKYHHGEPIVEDAWDYYCYIYQNFSKNGFDRLQMFQDNFEYLFPQHVIIVFEPIKKLVQELYESNKQSESKMSLDMTNKDETRIKELPAYFDAAIQAIRADLHLDNTFIHDFLEINNIKK